MPDFVDALSSYKDRFSDYLSGKLQGFSDWAGLRRKKYRLKNRYRIYRDYVKDKVFTVGKAYVKYVLFEYAPFVVAYGLMINFPGAVLLGISLTWLTVLSYGVVAYLIVYDVFPMVKELFSEIG